MNRKLTQQQLADLLPSGEDGRPTGKDQISRWERFERGMTMEVQAAVAEALSIEPADLFRDPDLPSIDRKLRLLRPDLSEDLHDQFDVLINRALEKQEKQRR